MSITLYLFLLCNACWCMFISVSSGTATEITIGGTPRYNNWLKHLCLKKTCPRKQVTCCLSSCRPPSSYTIPIKTQQQRFSKVYKVLVGTHPTALQVRGTLGSVLLQLFVFWGFLKCYHGSH